MPLLRLCRVFLRAGASIALALAVLWSAAALRIDGPESTALAGMLAGGVLLAAAPAAAMVCPFWRTVVAFANERGEP
jgi:hypothetical protein